MGRKKYSKELKARIALDAIKGQKTMSELASEYGVHANQISRWKKQLLEVNSNCKCTMNSIVNDFMRRLIIEAFSWPMV